MNLEPLVVSASRGDVDAFSRLVSATSALVASIALAIVRDLDVSKDVAQDVFLAVWRDLGTLRRPASFLPWLRQTTRNRAHHTLRTRIRARRLAEGVDEARLEMVADPRPTAGETLLAAEEARALADALDQLPDDTREIVLLYYREEQSAKQVAALLDLSEDAVKKRLSRARAAMRETLLERAGDLLKRTAPGAAFAAGVVATAISLGAPSAAAAATLAASKASGTAGGAGLAKVAAALGGASLGALGGVAGVLFGVRQMAAQARDDQERAALRRFGAVGSALVVLTAALFPIVWLLAPHVWTQIVVFAAFLIALLWMYERWLPRILARRMAAEMREDPDRAVRQRARERRMQRLGWTVGVLSGSAGLLYGLWSAGAL